MICYYYPPLEDVGCKRSVAFSRYLKSHGWEPYVLSVRNPDKTYCRLEEDQPPSGIPTKYVWSLCSLSWLLGKMNGLVSKLLSPLGIKLQRNVFYDLFCIPDYFLGWIPGAIFGGYHAIKKNHLDIIYVSCSPFSSAIAGMVLKKITGKPLIIDFRDPMAVNLPDTMNTPRFRKKINQKIEKKIIESSDAFVVNTDEVRQGYIAAYPQIADKTIAIHNGFDHQLLPAGQPDKFARFTIAYAGNMYFYANRSESFFQAIAQLKESGNINTDNFQFLYYGSDKRTIHEIAQRLGIEDLVHSRSSIPHAEMLQTMTRAHLQLLRIIKPMISTKLFEGIALNLPFLAVIPPGEVADIISKYSPSSYIVHEEDSAQAIEEAILSAMQAYENVQVKDNAVDQFLVDFSREAMTRKLEKVIEKCWHNQN